MLINNKHGTFVILEDKIFHIEGNHVYDTGPISKKELKEVDFDYWFIAFRRNKKLHRDNDLPAIIWNYGRREWYQFDQLHRNNDQPAVICANGRKEWYRDRRMVKCEP